MMKYAFCSSLVVVLVSACGGDPADEILAEEEIVAEADDAIIQAPTMPSFAGTVMLDTDQERCTATVLSEHWLLTSAHCIDELPPVSNATVSVSVSTDPAVPTMAVYRDQPILRFIHPSYPAGADAPHPDYDVGLVHLRSHGIDTTAIGRAKLNAGNSSVPSSNMIIAGFGRGSALGGTTDCVAGTNGVLRYRGQMVEGSNSTVAWTSDELHCPADSGGPWMSYFISGGQQFVQFGVHSGDAWSLGLGWYDRAATIKSTRAWIESTMQIEAPYRFNHAYIPGSWNSFSWRTYSEAGTITSPLKIGGWCVEPDGSANGSRAVLRACNGSPGQLWWLKPTGEIRHMFSNLCMNVSEGSTSNEAPVQLWDCSNVPASRFRHTSDGLIRYGADYDKCVDLQWGNFSDGAPLWLWDCNWTVAQTFQFN